MQTFMVLVLLLTRGVVALRGFETNSVLAWLREMDALRQALAASSGVTARLCPPLV